MVGDSWKMARNSGKQSQSGGNIPQNRDKVLGNSEKWVRMLWNIAQNTTKMGKHCS